MAGGHEPGETDGDPAADDARALDEYFEDLKSAELDSAATLREPWDDTILRPSDDAPSPEPETGDDGPAPTRERSWRLPEFTDWGSYWWRAANIPPDVSRFFEGMYENIETANHQDVHEPEQVSETTRSFTKGEIPDMLNRNLIVDDAIALTKNNETVIFRDDNNNIVEIGVDNSLGPLEAARDRAVSGAYDGPGTEDSIPADPRVHDSSIAEAAGMIPLPSTKPLSNRPNRPTSNSDPGLRATGLGSYSIACVDPSSRR